MHHLQIHFYVGYIFLECVTKIKKSKGNINTQFGIMVLFGRGGK